MQSEKNGTVIPGVDPLMLAGEGDYQGSLDLQPDPASFRDLAVRFRDDAATAKDSGVKEHFLKSAEEAEAKAEVIEASALWTAPAFR